MYALISGERAPRVHAGHCRGRAHDDISIVPMMIYRYATAQLTCGRDSTVGIRGFSIDTRSISINFMGALTHYLDLLHISTSLEEFHFVTRNHASLHTG